MKLCKENDISLFVFTTPHHKNMMDTYKTDDYLSFLERIADVVNFYDFSGYNSITMNDCNYYEYSHYRPKVGKLIAARIFDDKAIDIPADFGQLVTKNNVSQHIKKLKKVVEEYDTIK